MQVVAVRRLVPADQAAVFQLRQRGVQRAVVPTRLLLLSPTSTARSVSHVAGMRKAAMVWRTWRCAALKPRRANASTWVLAFCSGSAAGLKSACAWRQRSKSPGAGLISSHLASQGAQQQRVVAKGAEERQQLLARAAPRAANEGAPQRQRVVVAQPGEEEGIAAGPGLGRVRLEFRRVEPGGDEHARGAHLRQPPQEVPGARVSALAQAVFFQIGLLDVVRQAVEPGDVVGGLLVQIIIGQVRGVHARIGEQDALQAVEHQQEGPLVEHLPELVFPLRRGHLAHLGLRQPGSVGQRAYDEVLEVGVALVKAPPHPPCEVRQFVGRDVVEPLPREGALAHAADGDDVEEAHVARHDGVRRHPIGEQVQFFMPPNHLTRLQQRVGMRDVRRGSRGNEVGRVKAGALFSWLAVFLLFAARLASG